MSETKIINDPVFGFIKIPDGLLMDIVNHPTIQRLSRIKQLGLASMVYPGAQHTRFQHSLGAFHLMSEAILSLSQKGVFIFDSEAEAVQAAILLHDIGHGPFSHVLENTLIQGISHEEISLFLMKEMNKDLGGRLTLAINIFEDKYPKAFLHQLISSQLDMDRLDYLCRDSFFTGVAEGKIASDRIIKMLDVREDRLMVQAKGIYSIENYLTSRRLMYWQVYLHKTAVACEKILINILKRAKTLQLSGENLFASPALHYFISNNIDKEWINNKKEETIFWYKQLDDSDIWSAIKVWRGHPDKVLSILSKDLINRETFKVKVYDEPIDSMQLEDIEKKIREKYQLSKEESHYFINYSTIRKDMYSMNDDQIDILYKDGSYKDITQASELFNVELLSKKICKYYLCHQRI
ncbi:HD domain-containing protein [Hoylesella nanceiensis]|jgi:HD domain protein|uniref:HD domain-containing protein n=1 Tax=Hoylesella nanceiensis TaxID=425941 RepID=UPI001CAD44C0|nr:HD domain-containing protein [Hoylesella nanceiensis]MBF1420777.1 HD domain-containing protein [Hoylesella nanceiensis]MBF1454658.1 HD domain-containing protein [Hoylesella nanceiensis]